METAWTRRRRGEVQINNQVKFICACKQLIFARLRTPRPNSKIVVPFRPLLHETPNLVHSSLFLNTVRRHWAQQRILVYN